MIGNSGPSNSVDSDDDVPLPKSSPEIPPVSSTIPTSSVNSDHLNASNNEENETGNAAASNSPEENSVPMASMSNNMLVPNREKRVIVAPKRYRIDEFYCAINAWPSMS